MTRLASALFLSVFLLGCNEKEETKTVAVNTKLGVSMSALSDNSEDGKVLCTKLGWSWDDQNGYCVAAVARGVVGYQGAPGPTGPQGEPGPKGDKGDAGERGSDGAPGAQGQQGLAGLQGLPGPQGSPGVAGPPGLAGRTGDTGPQGPAGARGEAGPQGIAGVAGPTGPAGARGEAGPQGAAGLEGPQGPQGLRGDVGPAGPQGVAGLQGPPGLTGEMGLPGPMGPQGLMGDIGVRGERGEPGPTGATGPSGATGPQGPRGDTGPAGVAGVAGPTGQKGDIGLSFRVMTKESGAVGSLIGIETVGSVDTEAIGNTIGRYMIVAETWGSTPLMVRRSMDFGIVQSIRTYFTTSDCTGTPYVSGNDYSMGGRTMLWSGPVLSNNTYWMLTQDASGSPVYTHTLSFRSARAATVTGRVMTPTADPTLLTEEACISDPAKDRFGIYWDNMSGIELMPFGLTDPVRVANQRGFAGELKAQPQ